MCNRKLVTSAKFHAKTPSRSGVIKKNPPWWGGVHLPEGIFLMTPEWLGLLA